MRKLLLLTAAVALGAGSAGAQRVVLVSIDGLRPDFYLDPVAHGAELPAFRSLMREGVYAEAVEGVYPTVTYPSHTSIVTGALPSRHGILNNYLCLRRQGTLRRLVLAGGRDSSQDPLGRGSRYDGRAAVAGDRGRPDRCELP